MHCRSHVWSAYQHKGCRVAMVCPYKVGQTAAFRRGSNQFAYNLIQFALICATSFGVDILIRAGTRRKRCQLDCVSANTATSRPHRFCTSLGTRVPKVRSRKGRTCILTCVLDCTGFCEIHKKFATSEGQEEDRISSARAMDSWQ